MEDNSTPVNYTKLNLSDFNFPQVPEFNEKPAPQPSKKLGLSNVFLVVSGLAFVFAISYYVQSSRFETTSRATINPTMSPEIDEKTLLPRAYGEEDVAPAIVDDLKEAAQQENVKFPDMYVKDKLVRYYIYKDVMEENDLKLPEEMEAEQKLTLEKLNAMEQIIKDNLVSSADFAYITARFKILNKQAELEQTYGDLDERAKAVIGRYEQLFIDPSYTVDQIIDIANKDEELLALSNNQQITPITDYKGDTNVFVLDPSFSDFLYAQPINQLSELHTMTTLENVPFGYVIIYPTKIEKRTYNSLNDLIKERTQNFIY